MSDRSEGWYWVKFDEGSPWETQNWEGTFWSSQNDQFNPTQIGQRIPTPDEDWVTVPATWFCGEQMEVAKSTFLEHYPEIKRYDNDMAKRMFQRMIAAAPRFGDEP